MYNLLAYDLIFFFTLVVYIIVYTLQVMNDVTRIEPQADQQRRVSLNKQVSSPNIILPPPLDSSSPPLSR